MGLELTILFLLFGFVGRASAQTQNCFEQFFKKNNIMFRYNKKNNVVLKLCDLLTVLVICRHN